MGEASPCDHRKLVPNMGLSEYTRSVLSSFSELQNTIKKQHTVQLDGHTLRLSDAVAISKYPTPPSYLTQQTLTIAS